MIYYSLKSLKNITFVIKSSESIHCVFLSLNNDKYADISFSLTPFLDNILATSTFSIQS